MKHIISISPFCAEIFSWATWRISFIVSLLQNESKVSEFYRWTKLKSNLLKKNIFFGSPNKFIHLLDIRILRRIYLSDKNSLIYCHHIWSSLYGIFARIFFNRKYIFDDHNVEFDCMNSRKRPVSALFIYVLEFLAIYFSDKTVVSSLEDMVRIQQLYWLKKAIEVSENKYIPKNNNPFLSRRDFYSPLWIEPDKKLLLFFASFDYSPNREALTFIQKDIIPYLDDSYHVIVAGLGSENFPSTSKVTYLWFFNDIDLLIKMSDIIIAPIFSGWGVKIKVVQSLALKKYIITTQEGIRWIHNYDAWLIALAHKWNFLEVIVNTCNCHFKSTEVWLL